MQLLLLLLFLYVFGFVAYLQLFHHFVSLCRQVDSFLLLQRYMFRDLLAGSHQGRDIITGLQDLLQSSQLLLELATDAYILHINDNKAIKSNLSTVIDVLCECKDHPTPSSPMGIVDHIKYANPWRLDSKGF